MAQLSTLWRCRECGKWSHAKRDPIRHKHWHPLPPTDDHPEPDKWEGWWTWCGPFDRWVAVHDDPSPRGYVFGLGEPVSYAERERALAGPHALAADAVPF